MIYVHELTAAAWQFVNTYGYLAIFILLFVEESGVPLLFLPGDLLVVWAGSQSDLGNLDAAPVFLSVFLGVALGSSLLYGITYRWGRPLLERAAPMLHVNARRMEQAERWVLRRGILAVIVGRLIPGLRTPTTMVSGTVHLPYTTFVLATTAAAFLWAAFYFSSGMVLGTAWRQVGRLIVVDLAIERILVLAIAVLLAGVAIGFLVHRRLAHARSHTS